MDNMNSTEESSLVSNNDNNNNNTTHSSKKQPTIVDRTVVMLVPNANQTPSRKNGISPRRERLHRLHGTMLIHDAAMLLKQSPSTFATSCSILHRFYHTTSLFQKDVWSVAMACTLLAGKVEEEPRPIRHVIVTYNHLYRKRRLCINTTTPVTPLASSSLASTLDTDQKHNVLRYAPPLSPMGPIFQEWKQVLVETEQLILRQLGFTLYWIPDVHPHKYILYFLRLLQQPPSLARSAWKYCNTSCFLDLTTRYSPELIACAAILLAAHDVKVTLPTNIFSTTTTTKFDWWHALVDKGETMQQDIAIVCNAILGMSPTKDNQDSNQDFNDIVLAATTYCPSLVKGGSFNDPDSFIWSQAD